VIGSPAPFRISGGPLSPAQAGLVLSLAEAAQAADGVAPLSEDVLLQVRHGSGPLARDLLLTAGDSVAGYAHLDGPDDDAQGGDAQGGDAQDGDAQDGDISGELVVHPGYRRRGYGTALISALAAAADGHGIRLWAHGDLAAAAALARSAGFVRFRALWQMRMSIGDRALPGPAFPAGVSVRTFRPGEDEQSWLEVNRRAFAHHPEQGSWTREDLELREAEPWFDPGGFFLAERDGHVIGFHWTKVHPADEEGSPIGEVYVVGVDPGRQGGGLGRALTLTGLAHLRHLGLGRVMLYVDESNTAAVKLYTSLGFSRWSTDVMYRRPARDLPSWPGHRVRKTCPVTGLGRLARLPVRKSSRTPVGRQARHQVRSARAARHWPRLR
jgi:mycothiol synthase